MKRIAINGLGLFGFALLPILVAVVNPTPTSAQPGTPRIDAVSPLLAQARQVLTIRGAGFGSKSPYDGNSRHILISNVTRDWNAGCAGRGGDACGDDAITLAVARWSDTEVIIIGFTGGYGSNGWTLEPGDEVQISVWHAQSDRGPASFTLVVAEAVNLAVTVDRGAGSLYFGGDRMTFCVTTDRVVDVRLTFIVDDVVAATHDLGEIEGRECFNVRVRPPFGRETMLVEAIEGGETVDVATVSYRSTE